MGTGRDLLIRRVRKGGPILIKGRREWEGPSSKGTEGRREGTEREGNPPPKKKEIKVSRINTGFQVRTHRKLSGRVQLVNASAYRQLSAFTAWVITSLNLVTGTPLRRPTLPCLTLVSFAQATPR